jgi:drug/metabolite transporter (DMT)-like permease
MLASRLGEFAALATAFCWTFGALSFEAACKERGALSVNWIRLGISAAILSIFCLFYRGMWFPVDASNHAWLWLSVSGLVGFAVGDFMLFRAFVILGARLSMLIMAVVPPLTAILGWLALGEVLTPLAFLGMFLTIGGIVLVVLSRRGPDRKIRLSHPLAGILLALGGAAGQAAGLVLSKVGMGSYDAFAASQIRSFAGILGFTLIVTVSRRWPNVVATLKDKKAILYTSAGSLFGPALGVAFSLLAVQHTTTGVASTIMSIVPVLIIPPAVLFFKERITAREVIGAFIAVAGVAVLFL